MIHCGGGCGAATSTAGGLNLEKKTNYLLQQRWLTKQQQKNHSTDNYYGDIHISRFFAPAFGRFTVKMIFSHSQSDTTQLSSVLRSGVAVSFLMRHV